MSEPKRIGSIDIDQDIQFQKNSWKVQRVGWAMMLLIAAAAILGVFGGGPVSKAHAGDANLLRIDYARFVRLESPEKVTFNVGPAAQRVDALVELWIDQEWLEEHDVKAIVPEPSETRVAAGRVIYRFDTESTGFPLRIEFDLETKGMGRMNGKAGISGSNPVVFNQLAYP